MVFPLTLWLCRQKDIAVQVLHNASVLGSTSGLRSSCWKQQIWCHWLDLLEWWRNLPYLQKPFFSGCFLFFLTMKKYGFPVKFPEKQSNKTAKQQVGHGMALTNSFSTRGWEAGCNWGDERSGLLRASVVSFWWDRVHSVLAGWLEAR